MNKRYNQAIAEADRQFDAELAQAKRHYQDLIKEARIIDRDETEDATQHHDIALGAAADTMFLTSTGQEDGRGASAS